MVQKPCVCPLVVNAVQVNGKLIKPNVIDIESSVLQSSHKTTDIVWVVNFVLDLHLIFADETFQADSVNHWTDVPVVVSCHGNTVGVQSTVLLGKDVNVLGRVLQPFGIHAI